ncbi:PREDICTED: odorant receptor 22c-like isoform X2 [Vollenhovia emeryi]|uniref:odorant receptor 22c-like isoform X2 n=1 Tax=Vollenhovia emeryi TaxID=411798 RepID=UPI0005F37339|nr:PREDICTED: odorant receptor 22c-like isoform X2 [Vollenhovia emeryi]
MRSKISYGNMIIFIRLHYNIIQFISMIEIYHTIPFILDLLGMVIALSLALTQVLNIDNFEAAIRAVGVSIVTLSYLFISNYMGQRITDVSTSACEKVYNSAWYNADVFEQRSLLLILKRRFRPLVLSARRFYVMSLPSFGSILRTAISYCMFMRQL